MKNLYKFNFIVKMFFLLLTPTLFKYLNIGFIWHSIFWGVVTMVVIIWGIFIILSPIIGKVGCGWFCFLGTIQDFAGDYAFFKPKKRKPHLRLRIVFVLLFFGSALSFFLIRKNEGKIEEIQVIPYFLGSVFDTHYKFIWMYDTIGALICGLLLQKRWICRGGCFMGTLCAAGSKYSRLIPVIDTNQCTQCGKCETICPVQTPIISYIKEYKGLVTDPECLICGKCVNACNKNALTIKFVWNRERYQNIIEKKSVPIA